MVLPIHGVDVDEEDGHSLDLVDVVTIRPKVVLKVLKRVKVIVVDLVDGDELHDKLWRKLSLHH